MNYILLALSASSLLTALSLPAAADCDYAFSKVVYHTGPIIKGGVGGLGLVAGVTAADALVAPEAIPFALSTLDGGITTSEVESYNDRSYRLTLILYKEASVGAGIHLEHQAVLNSTTVQNVIQALGSAYQSGNLCPNDQVLTGAQTQSLLANMLRK